MKQWLISALIAVALVGMIVSLILLDYTGQQATVPKVYRYDVSPLTYVDPNLILYDQSGPPIPTDLSTSNGICISGDNQIFVAGDTVIRILDEKGSRLRDISLSHEPCCVTVDDDAVYVGLRDHIEVFDSSGRPQAVWPALPADAVITSMAVYKDNVFVADAGRRVVLHYDRQGNLVNRIGEKDEQRNIPGFVIPSPYFDLAVAPDGLLRVVDPGRHRIEAYTFKGDLELWWGRFGSDIEGFTGCCNPANMAILPDGRIVTCEKGVVRVKVFAPDGTFEGVVAGHEQLTGRLAVICETPEQCRSGGFDIAADASGRIYVLDTQQSVIRIFQRKTE
jgi:hypothetical protein